MSSRYRFQTLGCIDLTADDGRRVLSVLSRPKLLGVFSYLACPTPARMRTRDELMALFWAESDPKRSRGSLRKALHALRASLGAPALVATGDIAVGLQSDHFEIDVALLEQAAEEGRVDEVMRLYQGPFLKGFVMDAGNGAQDWLDNERVRLRDLAADTALASSQSALGEGRHERVEELTAWSLDIRPMDEQALRLRLEALAGLGDLARATELYRIFEESMRSEADRGPSPETRDLMADLRGLTESQRTGRVEVPREDRATNRPRVLEGDDGVEVHSPAAPRWSRTPVALTLVAVSAMVLGAFGLDTLGGAGADPPTVVVLPLDVPSDDPRAQAFSNALRDDLIVGLASQPGLRIFAASPTSEESRSEVVARLHAQIGADAVLAGTSRLEGERVHLTALLLDASSGEVRWSATRERSVDGAFSIAEEVAASLAQALEVGPLIPWRLEVVGTGQSSDVRQMVEEARVRYNRGLPGGEEMARRALELDSTFAPAWAAHAYYLARRGRAGNGAALDSAQWAAGRAVTLDPGHRYGHVVLASVAAWRGDRLAQLDHVLEALRIQPGYWAGLLQLSRIFRLTDRFDHAVVAQALSMSLGDASVSAEYRHRFETRFLSGETDEMIEALHAELEVGASPARQQRLILGFLSAGAFDEARELAARAFDQTDSADPHDLRMALAAVWDDRCDEAEPRLHDAIDEGLRLDMSTSTSVSTLLAHCALQDGRVEEAAGWIRESLALDATRLVHGPGGYHALYDLARVAALVGDPHETARWLARADSAGWEWVNTYMGLRDPILAGVADTREVRPVLAAMSRRQARVGRAMDAYLEGSNRLSYEDLIVEARRVREELAASAAAGTVAPARSTYPSAVVAEWLRGLRDRVEEGFTLR